MNHKKNNLGFTLMELLMVISIITLLSSMFLSFVGSAKAKSRDAVRLSDMKQINTAASMYYEDTGTLPISIGTGDGGLVPKYLSVEPKDPKTGENYKFSKVKSGDKEAIIVSATYESIYTTDNVPQKVGIVVGDIDTSNICSLIDEFVYITGNPVGIAFPTCGTNGLDDQIVGVSSGHRSGGNNSSNISTTTEVVSDCSESNVSKNCPTPPYLLNCYCENTVKNIDNLSVDNCKTEYGLYWDGDSCFNQTTCESASRVWSGGVCNPVEITYPVCSIQNINSACPPFPPPQFLPPNLINCYCDGTLNNINPNILSQSECRVDYNLYWDSNTWPNKCFNQTTCEGAGRGWSGGICNPPPLPEGPVYSDCSESGMSLLCPDSPENLPKPCYCDGVLWE